MNSISKGLKPKAPSSSIVYPWALKGLLHPNFGLQVRTVMVLGTLADRIRDLPGHALRVGPGPQTSESYGQDLG